MRDVLHTFQCRHADVLYPVEEWESNSGPLYSISLQINFYLLIFYHLQLTYGTHLKQRDTAKAMNWATCVNTKNYSKATPTRTGHAILIRSDDAVVI